MSQNKKKWGEIEVSAVNLRRRTTSNRTMWQHSREVKEIIDATDTFRHRYFLNATGVARHLSKPTGVYETYTISLGRNSDDIRQQLKMPHKSYITKAGALFIDNSLPTNVYIFQNIRLARILKWITIIGYN